MSQIISSSNRLPIVQLQCEGGDNEIGVEIIIPTLEGSIFLTGDYSTKEGIENIIQESKDNQ